MIYIKVIWMKNCPKCKKLIKYVLLPLQRILPDYLIIDFRETFAYKEDIGRLPLFPGGYYSTWHKVTPEVYMEDKLYIFLHKMDAITMMKFLDEIIENLRKKDIFRKMSVYREYLILSKIKKIREKLIKLYQREQMKTE